MIAAMTNIHGDLPMVGCKHCRVGQVNRPRGLCWTCYYTPGVRDLYPSTSKFARHGIEDFYGRGALPHAPTAALPGSPAKVAILEERARMRQELWHPNDASIGCPAPMMANPAA
jgi:hypothetical protein